MCPFNIRNGKPFYGEWGTGTNVIGGSNINLIGTHYIDSWGDGVSVFPNMNMAKDPNGGALAHQTQGLVIKNCVFDNNRRQGVSLGNIKNATIENNLFENTNGTGPASGMDLEPGGDSNQIVENVNIKHNTFINNTNQGLTMYAAQGTHVRNITVDGNTFSNNGSWATGQIVTNTVEGVEIKNNKILSNDGSRFFNIWLIGTSNANVHDNYGPNGSIVIAKDNPAVGYPTPSGTVKNNYISSITNDYGNAYSVTNNHLPNECATVSQKGDPNDWSKNITHPNAITNEKVVFHDFTDRSGKPITTVSSDPKNTVIGNSDMLRWKADFSFDILGRLLKQTTTGDDHIHFEKPMFTIYHNPDDQANLSEDQLYLSNQGADLVVNGQVVGKFFSSYIETNGTYTGSDDTVHVEVKNIPMGDGRLHVNNLQNNSAAVTIITTVDGNKYAYTAQSSKGDTNIPTDQSLVQNNNTSNNKPNSGSISNSNNNSATNSNTNTNSSSTNNSSTHSNTNNSSTNSSANSNVNNSSANSSANSNVNNSSANSSANSNINSSSANSNVNNSSSTNSSISTQPTTPIQVHDTTNYANKVLSDPNIGSLQDIGFHKEHAGQSSYQVGNIYYHTYNNGAVIFGSTNPNDDLFTNPKFRSQWTNTEHPEAYIKDGNKVTNITWDAHHSAVDGHIDYNQLVEEHVLNNTPTTPSSSANSNSSTPVTPSSEVFSSTVSNSASSSTPSSDVQSSSAVQSSTVPSSTPSSAMSSSATPSNATSSAIQSSAAVKPSSVSVIPSNVSSSATSSSAAPQTQSSSFETNAVTSTVTNNVTHKNVPNSASANSNSNNSAKTTAPQTNGNVLNSNLVQTNATHNQQNNGLALMMLGTSTLLVGFELNKIKLK